MELTNKKIILIVTIIVVILAVFTGISIYKYSDSSSQNEQPDVSENNSANNANAIASTVIASISPVTPTPIINTATPTVNADTSMVNDSTMSSPTPTVTVSITPSSSPNNSNSGYRVSPNFFNNSAFLKEYGRVNIQVYVLDNMDEFVYEYENLSIPYEVLIANETPVSDARMSLMKETYDPATRVETEELVNMPNNPLTASNCIIQGKPGYSFANVPPINGGFTECYTVRMEKNGRIWSDLIAIGPGNQGISGAVVGNDKGDIIPSDLTSGTIYGCAREASGGLYEHLVPASGANVTLYHYPSNRMVNVSNNPQMSGSGPEVGLFEFNGLQPGLYNVTAEKNGTTQHALINLTGARDGFNVDLYV